MGVFLHDGQMFYDIFYWDIFTLMPAYKMYNLIFYTTSRLSLINKAIWE